MTTHPVITNDVQMLEYLLNVDTIDADLLTTSLVRIGRNSGPQLISSLFGRGRLTDLDVLAAGLELAWTGAEFPTMMLETDAWLAMFTATGYVVDGTRGPGLLPANPIRLYRGATLAGAHGWSWTADRERAQWFADRLTQKGLGRVWTAEVVPFRLLAHFVAAGDEAEYVVDPLGMPIEVAS